MELLSRYAVTFREKAFEMQGQIMHELFLFVPDYATGGDNSYYIVQRKLLLGFKRRQSGLLHRLEDAKLRARDVEINPKFNAQVQKKLDAHPAVYTI